MLPKLVRDKVTDRIANDGEIPVYRHAVGLELEGLLRKKLIEEAKEYALNGDLEELADVMQVIDSICSQQGIDAVSLLAAVKAKAATHGAFDEGIVLETVLKLRWIDK